MIIRFVINFPWVSQCHLRTEWTSPKVARVGSTHLQIFFRQVVARPPNLTPFAPKSGVTRGLLDRPTSYLRKMSQFKYQIHRSRVVRSWTLYRCVMFFLYPSISILAIFSFFQHLIRLRFSAARAAEKRAWIRCARSTPTWELVFFLFNVVSIREYAKSTSRLNANYNVLAPENNGPLVLYNRGSINICLRILFPTDIIVYRKHWPRDCFVCPTVSRLPLEG